MKKPRLNNPNSKPLLALADVVNRHGPGSSMTWAYLKDEWFWSLGNKDEEWKLGEWFDFAMSTEAFKRAIVCSRSDKFSNIGNNVYRYLEIVVVGRVDL